MSLTRRFLWVVCILTTTITVGIIGYVAIEGWSFIDALYMTIITITTVGYAEVSPLSTGGRIFTTLLIIGGVGGALYALTSIMQYIIEGHIGTTWGRRRMKAKIVGLKGHFILCGFGGVGRKIAHIFNGEGVPFVAIDSNEPAIAKAEEDGYLCLLGDATNDDVLKEAGIERARGLVIVIGDDADSIYTTLTARGLRSDLFIEARANSEEAETKLKRAGADRVVSPNSIGARRMSMLALRPTVADFIDTVISHRGKKWQMESIAVGGDSALAGLTVKETHRRSRAAILAISKKGGKLLANPAGEETIEAGDRLIVMGTEAQLAALEEICEECKLNE